MIEPAPPIPGESNLVNNLRQSLSPLLNVPADEIEISELQAVDWPDGCLGLPRPGEACTDVITPGLHGLAKTAEQQVGFRSSRDGRAVRLEPAGAPANSSAPNLTAPVIAWAWIHEGACESAAIALEGVTYGPCASGQLIGDFASLDRQAELQEFVSLFAPFEAETPAGKILFSGHGQVTATPAEQRMLAEWARLVAQEAEARQGGASWGLALDWLRQGGIAGLCDDLSVYLSGEVLASSCQGDEPANLGKGRLTAPELEQLYRWYDNYQSFEWKQKDPATTDAMETKVQFFGNGAELASADGHAIINQWSADLFTRLVTPQDTGLLQEAYKVLEAYLAAFASGDFAEAAQLYGGPFEQLWDNNPNLSPDDPTALFQAYCTINGGVCNLRIKNIVHQHQLNADTFRFTVELENPDGTLFVRGPCCGGDPAEFPPQTQFDFHLVSQGDQFLVTDLPVLFP
jgi:hypothetical protein